MKKETGINLELLKKYVSELEKSLVLADKIKDTEIEGAIPKEYLTELCKGQGLVIGIVQEATLLAGDFKRVIQGSTTGASFGQSDLEDLMTKLANGIAPEKTPPKTGGGLKN